MKLLHHGKIEPMPKELNDFCSYCVGTYAILRIRILDSVHYYIAFLASADSAENSKPRFSRSNNSLHKKIRID